MKRIEAYLRLNKLELVKEALEREGIHGMSVETVRGFGRQLGQTDTFRGSNYALNLIPKLKIEIVVRDADLERALEIVCAAARTGEIGDGKIFVSEVIEAMRVRTGERGEDAI